MDVEKEAHVGRLVCGQEPTCAYGEAGRGGPGLRVEQLKPWVGASSWASRQVVASLLPASRNLSLTSGCHEDPVPG